jgi:hypothetical protein
MFWLYVVSSIGRTRLRTNMFNFLRILWRFLPLSPCFSDLSPPPPEMFCSLFLPSKLSLQGGWASVLKGLYHEKMFQLRPLKHSLGLNNPPRICFTPGKSHSKNLWRNKQGNCRCKIAGTGIHSVGKLRPTVITVVYHNRNNLFNYITSVTEFVWWYLRIGEHR